MHTLVWERQTHAYVPPRTYMQVLYMNIKKKVRKIAFSSSVAFYAADDSAYFSPYLPCFFFSSCCCFAAIKTPFFFSLHLINLLVFGTTITIQLFNFNFFFYSEMYVFFSFWQTIGCYTLFDFSQKSTNRNTVSLLKTHT